MRKITFIRFYKNGFFTEPCGMVRSSRDVAVTVPVGLGNDRARCRMMSPCAHKYKEDGFKRASVQSCWKPWHFHGHLGSTKCLSLSFKYQTSNVKPDGSKGSKYPELRFVPCASVWKRMHWHGIMQKPFFCFSEAGRCVATQLSARGANHAALMLMHGYHLNSNQVGSTKTFSSYLNPKQAVISESSKAMDEQSGMNSTLRLQE